MSLLDDSNVQVIKRNISLCNCVCTVYDNDKHDFEFIFLGSAQAEPNEVTCNSLKLQGFLTSGIYPLQDENQAPRLGYCDMSINGYLDVNLETSIGFIEAFPTPGRIIFSAYKAEGGDFSGDVTYSTLVENVGNGLDISTGVFSCPQSGLYMLSFSGLAINDAGYTIVKIYINGVEDFLLGSYISADRNNDQISHTWVVDLNVNDAVNLKITDGLMTSKPNDPNDRITFNGMKIK